jgi:hypothetical protein
MQFSGSFLSSPSFLQVCVLSQINPIHTRVLTSGNISVLCLQVTGSFLCTGEQLSLLQIFVTFITTHKNVLEPYVKIGHGILFHDA